MSQRTITITDYKDRTVGEAYILADGGIGFELNSPSILLLSREATDEIFKLIMDDRRERKLYGPHVGSFGGDL